MRIHVLCNVCVLSKFYTNWEYAKWKDATDPSLSSLNLIESHANVITVKRTENFSSISTLDIIFQTDLLFKFVPQYGKLESSRCLIKCKLIKCKMINNDITRFPAEYFTYLNSTQSPTTHPYQNPILHREYIQKESCVLNTTFDNGKFIIITL